jgi:UDP-N-acetylmuramoyl-L-alanyl-D-glutamate--2,6-diaminopimelate ligase
MHAEIEHIARALDEADLLVERRGALPAVVNAVADDSRLVQPGGLFIAVKGTERDGHDFLDRAARAGAAAAVVEDASRTSLPALVVRDGRRAAALAAAAAFDWPARQLQIVGVTGTNGKTTTVNMLRHLLDDSPLRGASIGTLGVLIGSEGKPLSDEAGGGLTTPGPVELQRVFRALVDTGARRVAMEVSSHALHQRRVEGVLFDVVTFTNLTRDHLDYHGTMDEYFRAKAELLRHVLPHGTVVFNLDDPAWMDLKTDQRRVAFSERTAAEVHATDVVYSATGSEWTLVLSGEPVRVHLPLIGNFNVANALGAAASAYALGMPAQRIAERLGSMPQVPGRLEVLHEQPTVLRDYSHTPDSLERALAALRPFTRGRLIVVFGCGGDRDRGKRPLMGAIAETNADFVILTSDNPRTEDPDSILDEIEAGMKRDNRERIEDRRQAIARALEVAAPDDVVLLAGKGHENYQIRGTTKLPFDEKQIVEELAGAAR